MKNKEFEKKLDKRTLVFAFSIYNNFLILAHFFSLPTSNFSSLSTLDTFISGLHV